jgi:hypothetical protein
MIPTASTNAPSPTLRCQRFGNGVVLFLLAAYLIFSHGCHGADVDDELCVPQLREPKTAEMTR